MSAHCLTTQGSWTEPGWCEMPRKQCVCTILGFGNPPLTCEWALSYYPRIVDRNRLVCTIRGFGNPPLTCEWALSYYPGIVYLTWLVRDTMETMCMCDPWNLQPTADMRVGTVILPRDRGPNLVGVRCHGNNVYVRQPTADM